MTFEAVNESAIADAQRRLEAMGTGHVNLAAAIRKSLRPLATQWKRNLPPPYATTGYSGTQKPVRQSIVVRAKKTRGDAWFGAVGGDRAKSPNARLLHLLELGHKLPRGGTARAFRARQRAVESTQAQRDEILGQELDREIDKALGF